VMVAGLVAHWGNCWHHARVADCCHENGVKHDHADCRDAHGCRGGNDHAHSDAACSHGSCHHQHTPCDCQFECCAVQQYLPPQDPQDEARQPARFDLAGMVAAIVASCDNASAMEQGLVVHAFRGIAPELRLHHWQQRWLI